MSAKHALVVVLLSFVCFGTFVFYERNLRSEASPTSAHFDTPRVSSLTAHSPANLGTTVNDGTKQDRIVRLQATNAIVNDGGFLQITVQNGSAVPIELTQLTWEIFHGDGTPQKIEGGSLDGSPMLIVTGDADGGLGTISPGDSKVFSNKEGSVLELFGQRNLIGSYAMVSGFMNRTSFEVSGLVRSTGSDDDSDSAVRVFKQQVELIDVQKGIENFRALSQASVLQSAIGKADSMRGSEMTPEEAEAFRAWSEKKALAAGLDLQARKAAARAQLPEREQEIYRYIEQRWKEIDQQPGGYRGTESDDLVGREAAEKFGVTPRQAIDIWQKLDLAGTGVK